MNEKKKSQGISRRKFLKDLGTGVVGTSVALHGLKGVSLGQELPEDSPPHAEKVAIRLKVNGKQVTALVSPETSLADFLRNQLQLSGTKIVCNHGECGACTVLLNEKAVYSCHMLALDAEDQEITTIEGLLKGEQLHPLQEAFIEHDGYQCGFCTPGQVMAAEAILLKYKNPTEDIIIKEMSGNLCRCAAYPKIIKSVMSAAQKL